MADGGQSLLLAAAPEALEPTHLPANPHIGGDEADGAGTDIEARQHSRDLENAEVVLDVRAHHACAADQIGAQAVLRVTARRGDHHVPSQRRDATGEYQMLAARLKKSWSVGELALDAEHVP